MRGRKEIRNRYVIEYRRLHEGADFEFSGVIGEDPEQKSLLLRHRDIFASMARAELTKGSKSLTNLDQVIQTSFGPLVSRTTTITSSESIEVLFGQYLAVAASGHTRRTRSR
ncbi:hypothetical protein H8D30_02100 [bacterium]|nr:hypothetical protein [bacterium]